MFRSAVISDWRNREATNGRGQGVYSANLLSFPIACETTTPSERRTRELQRTGTEELIDLIVPRRALEAQDVTPATGARLGFAPIAGGDTIVADVAQVRDQLDRGADVVLTMRVVRDAVPPAGAGGTGVTGGDGGPGGQTGGGS